VTRVFCGSLSLLTSRSERASAAGADRFQPLLIVADQLARMQ